MSENLLTVFARAAWTVSSNIFSLVSALVNIVFVDLSTVLSLQCSRFFHCVRGIRISWMHFFAFGSNYQGSLLTSLYYCCPVIKKVSSGCIPLSLI